MSASGAVAPLVGRSPYGGRAPAPRSAGRVAGAGQPVLPPALARGAAWFALALFGSLHWMAMLDPTASGRAVASLGVGLLAVLALLGAERLRPRARTLVSSMSAVVVFGLSLLASGLADELLRPDGWGTLAAGISRGISALPGARVPYRGIDEWTRFVITLGGTLLVVLAALAAFWPRRHVTGQPLLALILLVLLYVVPAVALDFDDEFMRGALLVVLVLAFLRLERLRARELGAAAGLAAAAVVLGLMLAPALDGNDPWWDYESWALTTAASQSTSFSWDHDYGPLHWPRDGREMLRVKAPQQAYWKAQNLDAFDGRRWQRASYGFLESPAQELPLDNRSLRRWTQTIEVSVRNLHTRTFVTAGIAPIPPDMPNRRAFPAGPPGIWVAQRELKRGDSYRARVYTPRPTERELAAAGTVYERDMPGFRSIRIDDPDAPSDQAPGIALVPAIQATFPAWGTVGVPVSVRRESYRPGVGVKELRGERLVQRSDLRRTYALSQRLKKGADNPFEYVKAVEAYLGRGFSYSESPPASARTLDGFLFDAKSGYCQQYSGAMALLLRMAGIPARVATGFSGGSLDTKTKEYVVRDLDAHSWVEAWFPGIGWATFDPTPSSAPPRSQGEQDAPASIGDVPQFGTTGSASSGSLVDDGPHWGRIVGLTLVAIVLLALIVAGVRHLRHRLPLSPLSELERALRRARRAPAPGATLQAIEGAFDASPAAAAYVRALRDQRYAIRRDLKGPTGAQRRGLRAELGRGGGLRARLRAWWALPPRPPARRRTLDMHG